MKKIKIIILNQPFSKRKFEQRRNRVEDIESGHSQKRTQNKRNPKIEHSIQNSIQSVATENRVKMNNCERDKVLDLPIVEM
jgi:hypothetical protein